MQLHEASRAKKPTTLVKTLSTARANSKERFGLRVAATLAGPCCAQ